MKINYTVAEQRQKKYKAKCFHCGKEIFAEGDPAVVKRVWLSSHSLEPQYCWIDPAHGSQLHVPSVTTVEEIKEAPQDHRLDFLLLQRKLLRDQLARVEEKICEHVTTWQGLVQVEMVIQAITKYREQEFVRTGARPSLSEAKDVVDSFRASLKST